MATALSSIIAQARKPLLEESGNQNSFWADDELLDLVIHGINDLWGAILDVYGEHFFTVDTTHVTLAADTETLSGVPSDVFRVLLVEPKSTGSSSTSRNVVFLPRKYNSPEFCAARADDSQDPGQAILIYYDISGIGAPVGAPTIYIAPKISSAIDIRLVYNPSLAIAETNPIPGASDNALKAWTVAWALAKDREDRQPDPGWLAIYATEKANILTRITPRQTQEPEVVEDSLSWGC